MRDDDRTAYRQSDTEAARLGRVEGFEQPREALRRQAWSRIRDRYAYALGIRSRGLDQQLALAPRCLAHGLDRVQDQVERDLLQLDAIADDLGQTIGEYRLDRHIVPRRFSLREFDDLADDVVDRQRIPFGR